MPEKKKTTKDERVEAYGYSDVYLRDVSHRQKYLLRRWQFLSQRRRGPISRKADLFSYEGEREREEERRTYSQSVERNLTEEEEEYLRIFFSLSLSLSLSRTDDQSS